MSNVSEVVVLLYIMLMLPLVLLLCVVIGIVCIHCCIEESTTAEAGAR